MAFWTKTKGYIQRVIEDSQVVDSMALWTNKDGEHDKKEKAHDPAHYQANKDPAILAPEDHQDLMERSAQLEIYKKLVNDQTEEIIRLNETIKNLKPRFINLDDSKDVIPNHTNFEAELNEVFGSLKTWARKYFEKIDSETLVSSEAFKSELQKVSWNNVSFERIKAKFLVQAVVGAMIGREVLCQPFSWCEPGLQAQLIAVYYTMLKENKEQALKWRATTLRAYAKASLWPPNDERSMSVEQHLEKAADHFLSRVCALLSPCVQSLDATNKANDGESWTDECRVIIRAALELCKELGLLGAELELIDREWYGIKDRSHEFDNDCVISRVSDESGKIDIVLQPGFIKRGDSEGGNYGTTSVWVPAVVELEGISITETFQSVDHPSGNAIESLDGTPKDKEQQLKVDNAFRKGGAAMMSGIIDHSLQYPRSPILRPPNATGEFNSNDTIQPTLSPVNVMGERSPVKNMENNSGRLRGQGTSSGGIHSVGYKASIFALPPCSR